MAKRYATVRQRVMAALHDQLLTIKKANGYNTDIEVVEYSRMVPPQNAQDGKLIVVVGESREDPSANVKCSEEVDIYIWYYCGRVSDEIQDLEFNLLSGDIQQCLRCGFTDPTHPVPSSTGIWMEPQGTTPMYNRSGTNEIEGMKFYKMSFFYSLQDNQLWDDTLDNRVEIDE